MSRKQFTTCPDGTSVAVGTEIIRASDGQAFRITSIIKEEGRGRYGKVTITARSAHDRSDVLMLSRHDLTGFQVNLSTVPRESERYEAEEDEKYLADPDYMQKKIDEEIDHLNYHFRHDTLTRGGMRRAKALGLPWAQDVETPQR